MVDASRAWCLERSDRQLKFARGYGTCVFAESAAARVTAHSQPAWKLVLPLDGAQIVLGSRQGASSHREGVLIAPQYVHDCASDGPHAALFVEAWLAPRSANDRPHAIGMTRTRRLLDALDVDDGLDLDAGVAELAPLIGPIGATDGRLAAVMGDLAKIERLETLSAMVGLSPSRLRAIVHSAVGAPLSQLRLWSRLAEAMTSLPHVPPAMSAAIAGFADQPHLTRTARRLVGRTPAEFDLRARDRADPVHRRS